MAVTAAKLSWKLGPTKASGRKSSTTSAPVATSRNVIASRPSAMPSSTSIAATHDRTVGTSMVLTLVTMASATVLHAATNHLVDAVLALVLMIGGVVGAQFGARAGQKLSAERLRLLLGLLVLCVGLRFAYDLVVQPNDLYSIRRIEEVR